ncbi:MAG: FtsX-like permease family protein [Lachnospiraceae bacterium]|nr:FtsX-like permease family protein [Lachnospiraceae bacterium]
MTRGMRTTTWREIRGSFGRFLAIAAIIALGVGFFAGLRNTTKDMIATTDEYLADLKMFDYRFVSTIGFTDEELEELRRDPGVVAADGEIQKMVIYRDSVYDDDRVMAVHTITYGVNELRLTEGRMPENANECVLDSRNYGTDRLGTVIRVAEEFTAEGKDDENDELSTEIRLKYREYVVVGLAFSPLYLNYERGTTDLLDGTVNAFMYIPRDGFVSNAYTSLYIVTNHGEKIYSDEYEDMLGRTKVSMESLCERLGGLRREHISGVIRQRVRDEVEARFAAVGMKVPDNFAYPYEEYDNVEYQQYCVDRNTNIGYVCFDNDAHIVEGIATVFPAFFILVAALVCMTTMSRMIEEQRTQIGVMKALGYTGRAISMKYVIYAGSGAVIGGVIGYFVGCRAFPSVIWKVYDIMYGFTDKLVFVWNPKLFIVCMAIAVLCPVGVTVVSIARSMREVPAELIRPRAPKSGRRILLERVPFLWNRLSFLSKVSVRNVVRYRRRFFMMVIGIAGCMALLIAGHGIRDSITTITSEQYGKIERYDFTVHLEDGTQEQFLKDTEGSLARTTFLVNAAITVVTEDTSKDTYLYVPEDVERYREFVTLTDVDGNEIAMPEFCECYINDKFARQLSLKAGDTVTIRREGKSDASVKIGGICLNYVGNCLYMTKETYAFVFGEEPVFDAAIAVAADGADVYEVGAKLQKTGGVRSVSVIKEFETRIFNMLGSLDLIVILVIVCAAALAGIVLYNLTNISITERIREIATIKVLGFRSLETSLYVFRENLMLTAVGAVCGVPLGKLLLRFVMSKIQVDLVSFRVFVEWKSYLMCFIYTFLFAVIVDLVMVRRLENVDMAESLKSIE